MSFLLNPYSLALVPAPVFELDAGLVASFAGGGSSDWLNLTPAPADDAEQEDYDFTRSSGGITFCGNAGDNSQLEYLESNGSGYFTLTGSNTAFLNSLHKENAQFTWYAFIKMSSSILTNTSFMGTQASSLSSIGISFGTDSNANLAFTMGNGSSAQTVATTPTQPVTGGWNVLLALTYNEATGAGMVYSRGAVRTVETFSQVYTSPSASAAAGGISLLSAGGTLRPLSDGTRIYRSGFFNGALTAPQLDALFNLYKHKLGY